MTKDDKDFWNDAYSREGVLSGESYDGVTFGWADPLVQGTLQKCVITNSAFIDAEMSDSSWDDSELRTVKFENCDLDNASFRHVYADEVQFINCKVHKLDLTGAKLDRLVMKGCVGSILADNADFIIAKFDSCNIPDSDFSRCDLTLATFMECDISQSSFYGADLGVAEFRGCDISEIVLTNVLKLSDPENKPTFADCIMQPVGLKGITFHPAASYHDEDEWETVNYYTKVVKSKDAFLICSDDTELETCELV